MPEKQDVAGIWLFSITWKGRGLIRGLWYCIVTTWGSKCVGQLSCRVTRKWMARWGWGLPSCQPLAQVSDSVSQIPLPSGPQPQCQTRGGKSHWLHYHAPGTSACHPAPPGCSAQLWEPAWSAPLFTLESCAGSASRDRSVRPPLGPRSSGARLDHNSQPPTNSGLAPHPWTGPREHQWECCPAHILPGQSRATPIILLVFIYAKLLMPRDIQTLYWTQTYGSFLKKKHKKQNETQPDPIQHLLHFLSTYVQFLVLFSKRQSFIGNYLLPCESCLHSYNKVRLDVFLCGAWCLWYS